MEETFRQSRAFNAPKLKGCSVAICPMKNILVAFQFFAFLHTQGHFQLKDQKLKSGGPKDGRQNVAGRGLR